MTSGDASWGQSKQREDSRLRRHLHNLLCWGINRGSRPRKSQGEWNHREMSQPSLAESLLPQTRGRNERMERIDEVVDWERLDQLVRRKAGLIG